MSIESRMKAVIESRKNSFYDQFDEYMADDEYYFTQPADPSFDFIDKYDADGNPVINDPEKEKIYKARMARFKSTSVVIESNAKLYYTEDESSAFFGFSYDEIIGMANNGVTIPEEILEWAYAMADANAVEISVDTEGANAHDLYTTLKNNPLLNIKTITKIFVNQCEDKTQELEAYLDELTPIEKEMEAATVDAETEREKSLNNIKALVKEWKDLQNKLTSGEALNDSEQARFEELKVLFGEEDDKYQDNIDNTTRNFTQIGAKLSVVREKADVAFDFGSETISVAEELAEFEKTGKSRNVFGGLVSSGISGVLGSAELTGNKNFSQTAHTIGMNTQYFADDINTTIQEVQLLMQDTANTAGFDLEDASRTVEPLANDEGVVEPTVSANTQSKQSAPATTTEGTTPEAEAPAPEIPEPGTDADIPLDTTEGGEGNEAPTEEPTESTTEEASDEEMMSENENTLEDVDAKTLSLPKLKRLIKDEGEDSSKKGQDALKLVEQLKTQSSVVEEKEETVAEDTEELKETSEAEPTEGSENSDGAEGAMEEAQVKAENSQTDLDTATEEEALTVEGLRETFKASTKANKKYSKDVDYANKEMKESIYTGAFTIAGGGYMSGVGTYNVITGSQLLALSWFNPVLTALGTFLINTGVAEIALGTAMIGGGTALTVSATEGLEINEEANEKIELSGEDITVASESLDEIDRAQNGGVEGEGNETEGTEENEDTEEPNEDEELNQDKSLLGKMNLGNETLPGMRSLVTSEGKQSATLGKENITKLTTIERQIPSLIEATIEMEQAKTQQAAASADPEEAATGNVQDPAEIYEEYRQDYKADLAQNNAYKKDIKETSTNAAQNLGYAALGSAAGSARIALGTSEIALGTILAMQWWNPVSMMLGLALIKKGTEDTALGTEMLATGLALTVNSTTTLAMSGVASLQVSESDEKTNNALETVDYIETEINTAVQEQLSASGEQDLTGMSVIDLLTLIINNGINSSVLGTENTEITEVLKSQLPQLLENAKAKQTTEEIGANAGEEVANKVESKEGEDNSEGDQNEEGGEETYFTQYKNDFKSDLETNQRYSTEISQAENMSPVLKGEFFLGAPIDKATNRINLSNEQTTTSLEEVERMEDEVKKAEEEALAAEEAQAATGAEEDAEDIEEDSEGLENTEYDEENAYIPDYSQVKVRFGKVVKCETAPADISQDEVAEDDEKDFNKTNKSDEKKATKAEKQEKKEAKNVKTQEKEIEKNTEETEETKTSATELTEVGEEGQAQNQELEAQGNAAVSEGQVNRESGQMASDEASNAGSEAESQASEAETLSAEVSALAASVNANVATVKSEITAATANTQAVVSQMRQISNSLKQDQTKMNTLGNQIKQESQASATDNNSAPQPEMPKSEPQMPQVMPKATSKKAPQKSEETEPDAIEAPAQTRTIPNNNNEEDTEPTVAEAPEGSDRIEYASDKEKPADFVGFVAQSDSLASGSVFVNTKAKTTKTNNNDGNKNGNNSQNNNGSLLAVKSQANKTQSSNTTKATTSEDEDIPAITTANRTTQGAFDINSMQGGANGNANDKTQRLRTSMEAVRTAAFNKQVKLNALRIRANNNVMANIQKEAIAQANAARQERLAREKQERIAKIKQYAGYVQMVGGVATTTGMIISSFGKTAQAAGMGTIAGGEAVINTGATMVSTGTTMITQGTAGVAQATGLQLTGATQITIGNTQITIGTAQETAGGAQIVTGTATTAAGGTTLTAGTVTASVGASLAAGIFTAPASPPPIAAGATGIASGTATIATGTAIEVTGVVTEALGITGQATGAATTAAGAATTESAALALAAANATIVEGTATVASGDAMIAAGTATVAAGAAQEASGAALSAAGGVVQAVGTYVTAAGAATSAGADIANGNILGGIASIVGAAASIVGVNANLSTLGQASVQLASNGTALAGQLTTSGTNQNNNQQQDQKKKKKFKEDDRTQGIIAKTMSKQQSVSNRFNK